MTSYAPGSPVILTDEELEAQYNAELSKHGTHDQKSHGNWATGGQGELFDGSKFKSVWEKTSKHGKVTTSLQNFTAAEVSAMSAWLGGEDGVDGDINPEDIESAMTKVFSPTVTVTNEDGTETVITTKADGWLNVSLAAGQRQTVGAKGSILINGKYGGNFGRETQRNRKEMANVTFSINEGQRHKGYGLAVLAAWEQGLHQLGFESMTVHGVMDGTVVWPYYGYDFEDPSWSTNNMASAMNRFKNIANGSGGRNLATKHTDSTGKVWDGFDGLRSFADTTTPPEKGVWEWAHRLTSHSLQYASKRRIVDSLDNYAAASDLIYTSSSDQRLPSPKFQDFIYQSAEGRPPPSAQRAVTYGGDGGITSIGKWLINAAETLDFKKPIQPALEKSEATSYARLINLWASNDPAAVENESDEFKAEVAALLGLTIDKHATHDQKSHGNRSGKRWAEGESGMIVSRRDPEFESDYAEGQFSAIVFGEEHPIGAVRYMRDTRDWDEGPKVEIRELYVAPEWRRQGVATSLLNQVRQTYARFDITTTNEFTEDGEAFWRSEVGEPDEVKRSILPTPKIVEKHNPGGHDQSSHGNWATGGFRSMPTVAGVNTDLVREVDPKKADAIDKQFDKVYGSYEVVYDRYKKTLLDAVTRSDEEKEGWLTWYSDGHQWATESSEQFDIPLDMALGVTAAISPMMEWGLNKAIADGIFASVQEHGVPKTAAELMANTEKALGVQNLWKPAGENPFVKAHQILSGESINDVLGGIKVRSFYNNLLARPGDMNVTIDSHMLKEAAGIPAGVDSPIPGFWRATPSKSKVGLGKDAIGVLPGIGKVLTDLTKDADVITTWGELLPRQAQSIIWSERKLRDES